jgi:diacylglycerol kinase (ATP)
MAETALRPFRPGILCNPLSGRIRRRRTALRRRLASFPSAPVREVSDVADVASALRDLAAEGVDLLVIVGGDGTVQMVLSCLLKDRPFPRLPVLAVVPAGTTNMTALDLGVRGGPLRVLRRLQHRLREPGSSRLVRRRAIRIQQADRADLYGMFFGAGAIAGGVRYFQSRIRRLGITGEAASGLVVLRFLGLVLLGRSKRVVTPVQVSMRDDTGGEREGSCLLLLASTLDRLLLGMRPYWGRGAAPLHVTSVREAPARFWRSLPLLVSGRGGRLGENDGYHSSNVRELELGMSDDFIVDGELYRADGPLHLSTSEPAVFLVT